MAYKFSIVLISFLLIQSAISIDPLFHFCFNSQNFTKNSVYDKNLRKLLKNLSYKTPPTGFGIGSRGQYHDNRPYGLSLCRGDVSRNDCKTCVLEASSEIHERCPNNKGAIIWYDSCFLKYNDVDFFGKIDYQNRFYMLNVNNVTMVEPRKFNQRVKELLTNLSKKACKSSKMFANGESQIEESKKIYGMVQCSRDVSDVNCKKCLDDAISKLPSCCDGKQGGRVVGGSCNIRYEIYPFLNLY
ncbi:antimicrobial ginkbilobin-2-like protein [Primulina huaijiensis]|uniref:antimicrobial ginkbilobin-2-like protein n=1 Tax=Primulina huaijiensis TaxID=1492673 RepID=UPI003CC75CE6